MTRRTKKPSQRQLRVGELVRHALAEILERASFRDPDLDGVVFTVTAVEMSPDLRHATAFVVPLGEADAGPRATALNRASSFFRRELSRAVELRFVPDLHFRPDTSFGEAGRIEALLRRPDVARDLAKASAPVVPEAEAPAAVAGQRADQREDKRKGRPRGRA